MEKYEKYKDSGIEWIGDIPEHWEVKRIRHLAEIYGRIGYRGYKVTDLVHKGKGAITISPSNMKEFNMNFDSCTYLSWDKYEESPEIMIYNGDILFVKTGSTYGKSSFVKDLPEKATINPQIVVLKNIESNNNLLWYIIKSNIVQFQVEQTVVGGTIPTISQARINNYLFPISNNFKEQTAIANYLDRKTAEIDELIADKKRLLELYEEEKADIINQAVTKSITPDVPMKDSGIEWLCEIPKHWVKTKLKFVSEKIGDGIHTTPKYVENSEYKFVNGNNLDNGSVKYYDSTRSVSEEEYEELKKDIKEGTVLISINGTIGKLALYANEKVILGKSAAYIETTADLFNKFLFYIFQSHYVKTQFDLSYSGSTINNLSLFTLKNLDIVLPNREEQENIVHNLESNLKEYENGIIKAKKLIDLLNEYRTTLISETVTGKIKVTE